MGSVLVGRDDELRRVAAALGADEGQLSTTLIVEGDAGVGKTSLVHEACARLDAETLVLRGTSLPLTSMTVPFLPLRSAFHDVADFDGPPTKVPLAIEAWLNEMSASRPVVVSLDDLQWADQGTLDVLLYMIAGAAERRLAIVATIRSDDSVPGRPVDRWVGAVGRMPRVQFLTLGPLDRIGTALLIEDVMGVAPDQTLVEDVYSHSRGHPYLTELAVVGLTPGSPQLPDVLPTSLTSAVIDSVRQLDPPVQDLLGILAVGGAPATASTLASVMPTDQASLEPLLFAAVGAGTIVAGADGSYWFRHPLTAEVLESGLSPSARATWHAAFASQEAKAAAVGAHSSDVLARIADHYHLSGNVADAYQWSLRAAESAREAHAYPEELRLLSRATELRLSVPDAAESLADLLHGQRSAGAAAGAMGDELVVVERLLGLNEPDPLVHAELLVRRLHLRAAWQIEEWTPEAAADAVASSAAAPASWQHALALATWCLADPLEDERGPAGRAAQGALEIARASGDSRALAWALSAVARLALVEDRRQSAKTLAGEAIEAALAAPDYLIFNYATELESLAEEVWSSRVHAEHLSRRRAQLTAAGAPHLYVAWLAIVEADSWLSIGQWRQCLACLRDTLATDPGPITDVGARITTARLATLQGRLNEAVDHMARVMELFGEQRAARSFSFDALRTEIALATGDHDAAFDAAMVGLQERRDPRMGEWLLPLAAHAVADQADSRRDAGADLIPVLARINILAGLPGPPRDPASPETELAALQRAALSALYASELGRARGDRDAGEAWLRTADACADATLPWEEAYACLRAAEALLLRGRGGGAGAATAIRRGLRLAAELEAQPLSSRLEELATMAHIRLDDVEAARGDVAYPGLEGLTEREREILGYVVAGRTYAEIAAELTISEKTVSSHISSLLRKTGATNRIHLAKLASETLRR